MTGIALSFLWVALILSSSMATVSKDPKVMPSVTEYFDQLKDDMTKLTWAHAVNSQALLKKALSNSAVMMLEADIALGTLKGGNEIIPIMAHPPANESDLSLKEFVDAVIRVQKSEKKGIKLDFKSTDAFLKSLDILGTVRNELVFPVWFNADILRGPVESTTVPVDSNQFLKMSAEKFPQSTLSLGWTTRYGPNITGWYTEEQLTAMAEAIKNHSVHQPVTFAVRAGIVAQSIPGIMTLVQNIDKFQSSNTTTLTIWMSTDSDPVDISELKNLILKMEKSRTFLDLPKHILDQLNLDSSSGKTPVSGAVGAFVAVVTSVSALFTNAFKLFD